MTTTLFLVAVVILTALFFDFTNGFHDSANAMATSVATGALRPRTAVLIAAVLNVVGAFLSTEVAKTISGGMVNDAFVTPTMIFAGLVAAILWNLGTWYYGLPSSSSHTLIGAILGVGIAFSALPDGGGAAVNWSEASKTGMSLIVSPFLGFTLTVFLMFILKRFVKSKTIQGMQFGGDMKIDPDTAFQSWT